MRLCTSDLYVQRTKETDSLTCEYPKSLRGVQIKFYADLCEEEDESSDSKWVEMALLKRLDSQFSDKNLLRCCFEARDFIPGVDYISSISDAIWSSRKTICIVTEAFLKDGWCLETFRLAQSRMFDEA
ncbi:hypothetical protein Z043_108792 [Scleropages formosus]|uniref:TIR domain-containing protein n=1 Tax=Scleropages formosus TaxID=113540 RepID=A0A0P7X5T4_SCLFO|nr:hypothetical protein Z043_108792 [Scleropages formosus]